MGCRFAAAMAVIVCKSVRAAAQRHGGTLTLHWENNWFTLRALLSNPPGMSCGQQTHEKQRDLLLRRAFQRPLFFAVCRTFGRMHKFWRRMDIVDKHKKTGVYPETICRNACAKSDRV